MKGTENAEKMSHVSKIEAYVDMVVADLNNMIVEDQRVMAGKTFGAIEKSTCAVRMEKGEEGVLVAWLRNFFFPYRCLFMGCWWKGSAACAGHEGDSSLWFNWQELRLRCLRLSISDIYDHFDCGKVLEGNSGTARKRYGARRISFIV